MHNVKVSVYQWAARSADLSMPKLGHLHSEVAIWPVKRHIWYLDSVLVE